MIKWLDYWVYCEDFIKVSVQKKKSLWSKKNICILLKIMFYKIKFKALSALESFTKIREEYL